MAAWVSFRVWFFSPVPVAVGGTLQNEAAGIEEKVGGGLQRWITGQDHRRDLAGELGNSGSGSRMQSGKDSRIQPDLEYWLGLVLDKSGVNGR